MKPLDALDPEIAAALESMPIGEIRADTLKEYRIPFEFPTSDAIEGSDRVVPGDPEVKVRVHRPKGVSGPLPCLYSMHGGGYVIGSYDMDNALFAELCPRVGMVGVSVDYRLAPETPYPGPLEDCYRGLEWTFEHADELGIDPSYVGVGGLSAGGGLAAALALLVRDRGELSLHFQLLNCPMLDDRQATVSSQLNDLPVWSKVSNEFGWRSYLGGLYGTDAIPHTASPARAIELSGLPPAFVSVGSVDGFLDEDVDYALRLNHDDVPCELHVYPGAPHGYQIAANSRIAQQSQRDIEEWLIRTTQYSR
jgi:acetyl esterase/lipase